LFQKNVQELSKEIKEIQREVQEYLKDTTKSEKIVVSAPIKKKEKIKSQYNFTKNLFDKIQETLADPSKLKKQDDSKQE
jgi:N-glycosylase/DNA lyase